VDPPPVIVAFDIGEQVSSRLLAGCPSPLVDKFDLQRVEEALHGRIIVAASRPAHRRFCFHCSESLAVRLGCVLAAAVGMADEAFGRLLPLRGHHQGGQRQLGTHMVAHRPADDFAGRQVEYGSEIQPSLTGRDVGDVSEPDAIGCPGNELLLQQVRRDRKMVAAVGRTRLEPATRQRADAVAPHQSRDAATACCPAFRAKRGMHPWAAVTAMMLNMEATHISEQRTVRDRPSALRTVTPCIIAAGRDLEDTTHQPDRPSAGVIADESKAHFGTSAKMPIAFFSTSRSMRVRSSSRFNRVISDA
jgi:hypothetical protein